MRVGVIRPLFDFIFDVSIGGPRFRERGLTIQRVFCLNKAICASLVVDTRRKGDHVRKESRQVQSSGLRMPGTQGQEVLQSLLREHVQSTITPLVNARIRVLPEKQ